MRTEAITYVLDGTALLIEIAATVIMFLNSPTHSGSSMVNEAECKVSQSKERRTRLGFLILCIGFIVQLISFTIKL